MTEIQDSILRLFYRKNRNGVWQKSRQLNVLNTWYEPGIKLTKTMEKCLNSAIKRFEKFHMK